MLQLANRSPFQASLAAFPDADGIDALVVVVKATFDLAAEPALATEQVPVKAADEYFGEPGLSSLRYAAELQLAKPGTDVVVVGSAHAPRGRPVEHVDVLFAIAGRKRILRVHGERRWQKGLLRSSITPAEPFVTMPITYERAFGGTHVLPKGGKVLAEERNPVGRGFRGKRGAAEFDGQLLPNVDDPVHPLRSPGDGAPPLGFGFVAPSWLPRRAFAGTYDAVWQKTRAPFLPTDFDARFFHCAHPDFVFEKPLRGGEHVELIGMSPHGPIDLVLPTCAPTVVVTIDGADAEPPVQLETVLLEPDAGRLCMTWKTSIRCDKRLLAVERVTVDVDPSKVRAAVPA